MGKLRLKLAQVMPHVWFHKLKEIGKTQRHALVYKRPSQSKAAFSSPCVPIQRKKYSMKGATSTHVAETQMPERSTQSPLPSTTSNVATRHSPAPPASLDKRSHLDMEELANKLKALSSQERRQYQSVSPDFSVAVPTPVLIEPVQDKANPDMSSNIHADVGSSTKRKLLGDDLKLLNEGSRSSHGSTSFTCDLMSITSDNRASSSLWERDFSSFTSESNSELFSVVEEMQSYYHGASLGRRSSRQLRREPEGKQKRRQNRGRSPKHPDVTNNTRIGKKVDATDQDMRTINSASYDLNGEALCPCKACENMQDVTTFCKADERVSATKVCQANEKAVRLSHVDGMQNNEECRNKAEAAGHTEDRYVCPDKHISAQGVTFGRPRQPAVTSGKLSPNRYSGSFLSDNERETGRSHDNGSFKVPPRNESVLGRSKSMHETKTVHEYSDDGPVTAFSAYQDVYPEFRKHSRPSRNTKSRGFCRNLGGTLCNCQRNPLLFADSSLYATPSHSPLSCKSTTACSFKDVADTDYVLHHHSCMGSCYSSASKGLCVQTRSSNAQVCDEDHRQRVTSALTDKYKWREYNTNACDVKEVAKGPFHEGPRFHSQASKPSKIQTKIGLESECDDGRGGCGSSGTRHLFQKDGEMNTEGGRESWYKGALRIVREKADHISNEKMSNISKVYESFAMVKCSNDPSQDFKESMMEMILHKKLHHSMDLVELLQCYLALNSPRYHDTIVKVFIELWSHLFHPSH